MTRTPRGLWVASFVFCAVLLTAISFAFGELDGIEDAVWIVVLSLLLATAAVYARRRR